MQVTIGKIRNSHGFLIRKPFLVQVGFEEEADMQVKDGVIKIPPIKCHPRYGWASDSQRIAMAGEDKLVWPEFGNEGEGYAELTC